MNDAFSVSSIPAGTANSIAHIMLDPGLHRTAIDIALDLAERSGRVRRQGPPPQLRASARPRSWSLAGDQTPFKDQRDRGTCWAFAGASALEAAYHRRFGLTLDLSEEYVFHMGKAFALNRTAVGGPVVQPVENNTSLTGFQGAGDIAQKLSENAVTDEALAPYLASQAAIEAILPILGFAGPGALASQEDFDALEFCEQHIPLIARVNCRYRATGFATLGGSPGSEALENVILANHEVICDVSHLTAPLGGHVLTLIGFDSDRQVFIAKNSWGENAFIEIAYANDPNWQILSGWYLTDVVDPTFVQNEACWLGNWRVTTAGGDFRLLLRRSEDFAVPGQSTRLGHAYLGEPWFPLPGQAVFDRERQQVAAVSRAPGNLDLFVIGFDNRVWSTFWNGQAGWNGDWFPLPGQAVFDRERQQVAAVSRASGNLDLFVIGFDNRVWSTFWNDQAGWNGDWFPLPGQAVFDRERQQVAAVSRAPGNLDLFVIGFDNRIWSTFWNDQAGWNGDWFPLPGQVVFDRERQQVAAVSRAPGNLDLFVIGFDNHVWSTFWNDQAGWNGDWFPLPGQAVFDRERQQVTAVSRAPGNLDLFVIGFDNRVWSTFWNDQAGWNGDWFSLPGQAVFDHERQQVAAVSRASGNLDLFVIGFDNHVWSTFWNDQAGWNGDWFPLLGQAVFDRERQQIAAVSRSPGNLDVFVLGFDNHAWTNFWTDVAGWNGGRHDVNGHFSANGQRLTAFIAPGSGATMPGTETGMKLEADLDFTDVHEQGGALNGPVGLSRFNTRFAALFVPDGGEGWQARHGIGDTAYQELFDSLPGQGFRPVFVGAYSEGRGARFNAVWVQRGGPAWAARHGLAGPAYQLAFDQLVADGFRPVVVCGYAENGQERYAALFEHGPAPEWQARHGLQPHEYQAAFDALAAAGFVPVQVSGYRVNFGLRFAAIWQKLPGVEFIGRHNLTASQYRAASADAAAGGFRLVSVSGYSNSGIANHAAIWHRGGLAVDGQARHGLDAAAYQGAFDELAQQGLRPAIISGYGDGFYPA